MAKDNGDDVIAFVQQTNAEMEALQAEASKKLRAYEKAVEKTAMAKDELEAANKAVVEFTPQHKEAARKMVAHMSKDPVALAAMLSNSLKTANS